MRYIARYLKNIIVWLDEGVNTVLFFGDPSETISSRLGRVYRGSCAERLVDRIFGRDHCENSIQPGDDGKDEVLK